MKLEIEIETPRTINFVRLKMPPRERGGGFKEAPIVSIGTLTDEQICQIADKMKLEMLETAKNQRLAGVT